MVVLEPQSNFNNSGDLPVRDHHRFEEIHEESTSLQLEKVHIRVQLLPIDLLYLLTLLACESEPKHVEDLDMLHKL